MMLTTFLVTANFIFFFYSSKASAQDGFFKTTIGGLNVTAIADNAGVMDFSVLNDIDQAALDKAKEKAALPDDAKGFDSYVNVFVVETKAGLVLVDAGYGRGLPENIKKAGINPDDIAYIFLTHFHPDHITGLVTSSGKPFFPNASVYASDLEDEYWSSDPKRAEQVKKALDPYGDRYKTFKEGETIIEGAKPVALYGHTPGHTGFLFEGEGQNLLVWGDIVHVRFVQFDNPSISVSYDVDPQTAVQTRLKLFADLVQSGDVIAGTHLPYPGIGSLAKSGEAYDYSSIF
ncbi:MAG: MBL fold metallo-hydrolase [Deltaproteobacteria bacterium]|nr:MBL fold metallo-hydrolase [Deltaproteobacteria bacterium]